MSTVKDGWHKVYRYDVLIEDGLVVRATDWTKPLYPYRKSLCGRGWDRIYTEEKLTLSALRDGMRRGTMALM